MGDVLDVATRPLVTALGQSRERATARQRNPHRRGSLDDRPGYEIQDDRLKCCDASAFSRKPVPTFRADALAWLSRIVARFGGWTCYGKPPSPRIVARGWDRFAAALTGAMIAQANAKPV